MFIDKYKIIPETMKANRINLKKFVGFTETVDMLQNQWELAEKIMFSGTAEMFDLLGVFQQIYNHFTQILRINFYKYDFNRVKKQISEILENIK